MNLHGEEANVDVMVEAKAKEHTIMEFRKLAGLDVKLPKVGLVMCWQGSRDTCKASGMTVGGSCPFAPVSVKEWSCYETFQACRAACGAAHGLHTSTVSLGRAD